MSDFKAADNKGDQQNEKVYRRDEQQSQCEEVDNGETVFQEGRKDKKSPPNENIYQELYPHCSAGADQKQPLLPRAGKKIAEAVLLPENDQKGKEIPKQHTAGESDRRQPPPTYDRRFPKKILRQ